MDNLTSYTNTEKLIKAEIRGYPRGAPLQVNCVGRGLACIERSRNVPALDLRLVLIFLYWCKM